MHTANPSLTIPYHFSNQRIYAPQVGKRQRQNLPRTSSFLQRTPSPNSPAIDLLTKPQSSKSIGAVLTKPKTHRHGVVRQSSASIQICVSISGPSALPSGCSSDIALASIILGSLFTVVIIAGLVKVFYDKRRFETPFTSCSQLILTLIIGLRSL